MVDQELIKYLIKKLEDKIKANPMTPEFVKLANYYLIDGSVNEAINLLESGLKFYPDHTTAQLILGKCYLANKYYFDARKVFESLLTEHPDMKIAKKFLDVSNELARSEVSRKAEYDVVPKLDFKTPEFNNHEFNYNLFPSYEIEDINSDKVLLNAIEETSEYNDFRKVYESPFFFKKDSKQKIEKKRLKNKFELKLVTETLADIFAKQGNYFDALEAYTFLLKQKPERKEPIENKINEVEVQINKLINDF